MFSELVQMLIERWPWWLTPILVTLLFLLLLPLIMDIPPISD